MGGISTVVMQQPYGGDGGTNNDQSNEIINLDSTIEFDSVGLKTSSGGTTTHSNINQRTKTGGDSEIKPTIDIRCEDNNKSIM